VVHVGGRNINSLYMVFVQMKGWACVVVFLNDSTLIVSQRVGIYFIVDERRRYRKENLMCMIVLVCTRSYGTIVEG